MRSVQFDLEILYVQKLYFFMYLATLTLLATTITTWRFGLNSGLHLLLGGLCVSYVAMIKKKTFTPPEKKVTAKRMARAISQDTSPMSIARFASQLYYYFQAPTIAISLLEKFLPSHDPLLCTTLGDILLKEGNTIRALYVLRDNPHSLVDPLMLATQGRVLVQVGKIPEAAQLFERSLHLEQQHGFPHSGSHWLTQKILTLSYKASIHHSLADCYVWLEDLPQAKRHYRAGNRLLLDPSLWRHCPVDENHSAKSNKNSY
ncbi:tetratricopeptide repeat protein [Desulfosporosinus sp. Sb-LF]|uniref:tetratricopeptide repeat protein n=1 Tax=Desulfosporosinus sp. Sb-LF TaxID=2560027 RepID=UPI00107F0633|nr:tetratricopeptide repeat protein [Desulfosporosinus sp. Sb-LF]TGE32281.1 tetratricopeptide repeat protein [Desulfosporosinus sp. Sb-LF]